MVVKNNIEHVREHDKSITLMFGEKPKRVFGGVMTKCDKPREYGSYHAEFESDGMALNEEYQELCFLDTRIFGKEYVLGGVYDSAEYKSYLSHFENKNRQMKRVFIDGFSGRSLQQKIDGECEFIVGLISEGNESAWTGSLYKIPQDCQDAIVEWQHRTACNVTKGERYRNTATKLEYALKFFDEDGNLISRKDFYLQNLDIMNIACVLLEDSHYDRAMDVFLGGKRLWLITPLVGGFAKKFVKWISIDIPKDDVAKIAKAVVSFEKEHLKATSSTTVNRQRVLTDAKKEERNKRAREILDNAKKEYYREKAEEERIKLYYPEAYDAYKRNHNEYKAWRQQMYRQGYW